MDTITEETIREKLSTHYGGNNDSREFVKNVRIDDHGTPGSVVYSLSGSPPKGYAIYIPELRMVSLYNNRGKRFRIMRETEVVGAIESGPEVDAKRIVLVLDDENITRPDAALTPSEIADLMELSTEDVDAALEYATTTDDSTRLMEEPSGRYWVV